MIFPDVPLEAWLKRYPKLEVLRLTCHWCKQEVVANIPALETGYASLVSPGCGCGGVSCSSSVAISDKEIGVWKDLIDGKD